jgi:hypothetical protein
MGGRRALNTQDVVIEQKAPLVGDAAIKDRGGDKIEAAPVGIKDDYLDQLAFNEEPVTIHIQPSAEKNAATAIPVWVNGKGCEVFLGNSWIECPYLPVNTKITLKRKYLEVLVRAKVDVVTTEIVDPQGERPDNRINRFTSAVASFSVIEDKNPKGAEWLIELRRRNL